MGIQKKHLNTKKIFNKIHQIFWPYYKSYSQTGEDLIVQFIFKERGISKPSYIDIGAFHPSYINNTKIFYNKGSKGINIEPNPQCFRRFLWSRVRDINLNIGMSDKSCNLQFYIMSSPTLSTFSKESAYNLEKEHNIKIKKIINIPVLTLKEIIDRYFNGNFPDFLSIDTEGWDEIIIKSGNFKENGPKVICIETITYSTTGKGLKDYTMVNFLKDCGYIIYADTNINTILVKKDFWELP